MAGVLRSTRALPRAALSNRVGRMDHRLSAHSTPKDHGCQSLSVMACFGSPRSMRRSLSLAYLRDMPEDVSARARGGPRPTRRNDERNQEYASLERGAQRLNATAPVVT